MHLVAKRCWGRCYPHDQFLACKFREGVKSPSYLGVMPAPLSPSTKERQHAWQLLLSPSSETFPKLPLALRVVACVLWHLVMQKLQCVSQENYILL